MKVRTVTVFADPGWPLRDEVFAAAGRLGQQAREAFGEAGFEVQTVRLALPPFPDLLGKDNYSLAVRLAQDVEAAGFIHNLEYQSLGPARPDDDAAFVEVIPDIIEATQNVFVSLSVAEPDLGLSLLMVRQAAQAMLRIMEVSGDGLGNQRFGALARVPASVPFFPAGYARAGQESFGLGIEGADLVLDAIENAHTLADARAGIVSQLEENGRRLAAAAKKATAGTGYRFDGIDYSPAPYPDEAHSLGLAFERLGAPRVGWHGTLAAAAFVADALDRAEYPRTGFCGLFLPVLEDVTLAARSAEGSLTVSDLLTFSAVCGTGLDCVPLPGDVDLDDLAAIILDVAALALRLDKPLTARLLPVPGKKAGDEAQWDYPFFAAGKVLAPRAGGLGGPLAGVERFELAPKRTQP